MTYIGAKRGMRLFNNGGPYARALFLEDDVLGELDGVSDAVHTLPHILLVSWL